MYTLFILFFASLIGIIVMIGRKLQTVRNGQITESYYLHPFVPDFQKIKHITYQNVRKYGHLSLVTTVRFYIISVNFIKNKYQETKIKIKNKSMEIHKNGEKKEISKFLKIIGDYKSKIREIKHKIKKEENL